jgi:hypothetical protein
MAINMMTTSPIATRRAERPVSRLQEEIDQSVADEEHLAAAQERRDQVFAHQVDENQQRTVISPGMESGKVT